MRALVISEFGATPAVAEVPKPEPGAGEVRVRVRAASINGFDLAVVAGRVRDMMEHRFPAVLGMDFAGEIDRVGEGVGGFSVGDRVVGSAAKPHIGDGAIAEYVIVAADSGITPLPDAVDDSVAATLPTAGAAALAALDAAGVDEGGTVLVAGAAGGVGHLAVQIAAARGLHVIATATRGEAAEMLMRLGAEHIVDPDRLDEMTDFAPKGVDAALHLAGDPAALLPFVGPGGRFASLLGFGPDQAGDTEATVISIFARVTRDVIEELLRAVADGSLEPIVQRTYSLENAADALTDFTTGKVGKLVVVMN